MISVSRLRCWDRSDATASSSSSSPWTMSPNTGVVSSICNRLVWRKRSGQTSINGHVFPQRTLCSGATTFFCCVCELHAVCTLIVCIVGAFGEYVNRLSFAANCVFGRSRLWQIPRRPRCLRSSCSTHDDDIDHRHCLTRYFFLVRIICCCRRVEVSGWRTKWQLMRFRTVAWTPWTLIDT